MTLKSLNFSLLVVTVADEDLSQLTAALQKKRKMAPDFFVNAPVVVHIEHETADIDFLQIKTIVDEHDFILAGISGELSDSQKKALNTAKIAILRRAKKPKEVPVEDGEDNAKERLSEEKSEQSFNAESSTEDGAETPLSADKQASMTDALEAPQIDAQAEEVVIADKAALDAVEEEQPESTQQCVDVIKETKTRIIHGRVRSGQRIHAEAGDLVINGDVSPGAEVIADGNIHVYGALRGRALAGAKGDRGAAVFCRLFAPELVSIAGVYKLIDALPAAYFGKSCMVALRDEQMILENLN